MPLAFTKTLTAFAVLITLVGCEPQSATPTEQPQQTAAVITAPPVVGFEAKVIGVIDGDTVDVLLENKTTIRLRFNAIDAPERGQPFGNNAKQFVSDQIFGKQIRIVDFGRDRYDRMIADLYRDGETMSVNAALVHAGLAWHYTKYSSDETLTAAQREAEANQLGLWSDPRYVAPWDWRKLSKEERDKLR